MKTVLLFVAVLILLGGCSTLNGLGVGGEPRLACMFRDGTAVIDDRVAGSDQMRGSMVRRFEDGDSLCMALMPAPAASQALR